MQARAAVLVAVGNILPEGVAPPTRSAAARGGFRREWYHRGSCWHSGWVIRRRAGHAREWCDL